MVDDFVKSHTLHNEGFYIGVRDQSRRPEHKGDWMVCAEVDAADDMDSYCIVGDDLLALIAEAFAHNFGEG